MSNRPHLEVCVESVDHARAAERGGADRIELCSDLSSGGITPSLGLMQTVRRHLQIPIHVLIRPRAGDFFYSDHEFEIMRDDILAACQCGMNGIVLGILQRDGHVDIARTKALVDLAYPLPVTFHRAFDESPEMESALHEVIQTGSARILTSGGQSSAIEGLPALTRLVQLANGRIAIMPGGGINYENVVRIIEVTSVREIHTSLGTSDSSASGNGNRRPTGGDNNSGQPDNFATIFEQKVADLVGLMASISPAKPVS
jgi:copper homeostasis protein